MAKCQSTGGDMQDGLSHERNAIITLMLLGFLSIPLFLLSPALSIGLIWGAICGFFIDPDLDHRGTTRAEYRMYRVNRLIGALFHMYWTPYQTFIRHGSLLSHGGKGLLGWVSMALIATPIRIVYSLWWLIPLALSVDFVYQWLMWIPGLFWLGLYLGWAAQDFVHWLRDEFD